MSTNDAGGLIVLAGVLFWLVTRPDVRPSARETMSRALQAGKLLTVIVAFLIVLLIAQSILLAGLHELVKGLK